MGSTLIFISVYFLKEMGPFLQEPMKDNQMNWTILLGNLWDKFPFLILLFQKSLESFIIVLDTRWICVDNQGIILEHLNYFI